MYIDIALQALMCTFAAYGIIVALGDLFGMFSKGNDTPVTLLLDQTERAAFEPLLRCASQTRARYFRQLRIAVKTEPSEYERKLMESYGFLPQETEDG